MPRNDDLETLKRRMAGKRWVWITRPTLLHGRATEAGQCPCGCESRSGELAIDMAAVLLETIPGRLAKAHT